MDLFKKMELRPMNIILLINEKYHVVVVKAVLVVKVVKGWSRKNLTSLKALIAMLSRLRGVVKMRITFDHPESPYP